MIRKVRGCGPRENLIGMAIFGSFISVCMGLGWYFGGVTVALLAFPASLGVSFVLLDVDRLPSDEECEGVLKEASCNDAAVGAGSFPWNHGGDGSSKYDSR